MARNSTSSAAKSSSKAAAKPEPKSDGAATQDATNFELRSLQRAFDADRRYAANRDELLAFYEKMLLIRRFEERAGQLYGLGLIGGFCHLYIGQEAVAVGLQSALEEGKDSVITG